MSQWGQEKTIGGAVFIPSIATAPFVPASRDDVVDMVLLIDDGGNLQAAQTTLKQLEADHIGQPYQLWLGLL